MPHLRPFLAAIVCLASVSSTLTADDRVLNQYPLNLPPQAGRYTPLHHRAVPGKVGQFALVANRSLHGHFQPVRVELPSQGLVSFYTPERPEPVLTQAPAMAAVQVGLVYRFKLSGLPEFPGVELYPSIEVIDRLHPPPGFELEFPIPVEITAAEIEAVLEDRLVTKVIYLEDPRKASSVDPPSGLLTFDVPVQTNMLDAAGQMGRPVAILRLGGRTPDPNNPYDELLANRAPIVVTPTVPNQP